VDVAPAPVPVVEADTVTEAAPVEAAAEPKTEEVAPPVEAEVPAPAAITLTNIGPEGPTPPATPTEALGTGPEAPSGPQPTNPLDPTTPPPAIEAPAPPSTLGGLIAVEELSDPGQLFIPEPTEPEPESEALPAPVAEAAPQE
jgi:hypothetical protein